MNELEYPSAKIFEKEKNHNYKCHICEKGAEISISFTQIMYNITLDGMFVNQRIKNPEKEKFFCNDCYKKTIQN